MTLDIFTSMGKITKFFSQFNTQTIKNIYQNLNIFIFITTFYRPQFPHERNKLLGIKQKKALLFGMPSLFR